MERQIQEAVCENSKWDYDNYKIARDLDMGWVGGKIKNQRGDTLIIFPFKEGIKGEQLILLPSPNIEISIKGGPTIHYNGEHQKEERMWASNVKGVEYEFDINCLYLEQFLSIVEDRILKRLNRGFLNKNLT